MNNDKKKDKNNRSLTYADTGVDISAGNTFVDIIKPLAKSTQRTGSIGALGGFGGLFDLKAIEYQDPLLVAANDGVGTKLKIAIETGKHDTIGIDLVAMCVNDLVVQGAEPLFFLDYYATGKLNLAQGREIMQGIAEGCLQAGAALIGGETAEMPGLYKIGDYDLAGFALGAVERQALLPDLSSLNAGDVIIALASSGPHSNGYSLIRNVCEQQGMDYATSFALADQNTQEERSLGDVLLTPTRIYVKSILSVLRAGYAIKALAHITGGGLQENVPRVLTQNLSAEINLTSLHVPTIFQWLSTTGNIEPAEMLRTFNCGVGMVIIVAQESAEALLTALNQLGETAYIIGELQSRDNNDNGQPVTFSGQLDLTYEGYV